MSPVAPPTPSAHHSHRVPTQFFWARMFCFSQFLVFVLELTWFMVRTCINILYVTKHALLFCYSSFQRSQYVRTKPAYKVLFLFFCPDFCFKKRGACFFSSGILFSSTMFFFLLLFRIVQLSRVIFNLFLCFVLSWFLFWRKVFFPLLFWGFDKSSGRKRFEGGGKDAVVGERGGSFVFWRAIFSNLFFFSDYLLYACINIFNNISCIERTHDGQGILQLLALKLPYVSHQNKRRWQVFATGNAELSGAGTLSCRSFLFFSHALNYMNSDSFQFLLLNFFFVSEGFQFLLTCFSSARVFDDADWSKACFRSFWTKKCNAYGFFF